MTNVITYIIIYALPIFVNVLSHKIRVKTYVLFKSERKIFSNRRLYLLLNIYV